MSLKFTAVSKPFPRWWGPFSPARGTRSGFRFHDRRLGTWVDDDEGLSFWFIAPSAGVAVLEKLVLDHFRGGRVLFLPNGSVVKPLQQDIERGRRVYLGEFTGDVVLEKSEGGTFSFASPGALRPGDVWSGPSTTGLECVIKNSGALECKWYHPTEHGRDTETKQLTPPSATLAQGFRAARPGESAGRVRVTARGHVITNRQVRGVWQCLYVGRIDSAKWPDLDEWFE